MALGALIIKARLGLTDEELGLPLLRGQVDRSHAMTLRLSINDQPDQNPTPVYGPGEAGVHSALPQ